MTRIEALEEQLRSAECMLEDMAAALLEAARETRLLRVVAECADRIIPRMTSDEEVKAGMELEAAIAAWKLHRAS